VLLCVCMGKPHRVTLGADAKSRCVQISGLQADAGVEEPEWQQHREQSRAGDPWSRAAELPRDMAPERLLNAQARFVSRNQSLDRDRSSPAPSPASPRWATLSGELPMIALAQLQVAQRPDLGGVPQGGNSIAAGTPREQTRDLDGWPEDTDLIQLM
jgi:hypothetical protein